MADAPPAAAKSRIRRLLPKLAIAAVALLVCDQIVNYAVLGEGWLGGRRIAPFDPPIFTKGQLAKIESLAMAAASPGDSPLGDVVFDAELGWCTPPEGSSDRVGQAGSRVGASAVPRERTDGVRRIATFGCSFTYGSEVEAPDAWPAQLDAMRDDLEVLNFGVPGYGPDQALMRFLRVRDSIDVDEVWLGLLPVTVMRLVSMYRPALRHYTNTVACKPRFVLGIADDLVLVDNPAQSIGDLVDLLRTPHRFSELIEHDAWMAQTDAAYRPRGESFAHYFATSRLALTLLDRRNRDWPPHFQDEASEPRRVLESVLQEFVTRSKETGAEFRLVLLADHESLARRAQNGRTEWDEFVHSHAFAIDPSAALQDAGDGLWATNGHYSAKGNRVVAEALSDVIR